MDDEVAWMMIYASLIGFERHPGNKERLQPIELAQLADDYFYHYQVRREVRTWVPSSPR